MCLCESQKVTTILQSHLLFAAIWGVGGALTGKSRNEFSRWFRDLVAGNVPTAPRPKSYKLSKMSSIPDKGQVFDYVLDEANGVWVQWIETVDKKLLVISPQAKVKITRPLSGCRCENMFFDSSRVRV